MYQSFKISNFRCFRETTLNSLERVNLIAGMNNVGKTALLEALFLHSGAYNPELTLRLNAFRGIEQVKLEFGRWVETPWDSLFSQFDTSKILELAGENEQTGHRILRLRVIRQPEELVRIGQSIQHSSDKSGGIPSFSSEMAQVLELECTEGEQRRKYYMILDQKGVRSRANSTASPISGGSSWLLESVSLRLKMPNALENWKSLGNRTYS
jgi:predicted ATPase